MSSRKTERADVEPASIRFHTAQHAIVGRSSAANLASPATLPAYLDKLPQQARDFALPPTHRTIVPPMGSNRANTFPTKNASQR